MTVGGWISVISAGITVLGVLYSAWKSSNTTLERTNYQNAIDLYNEYKELNVGLKNEAEKNEKEFLKVYKQLDDMKKAMAELKDKHEVEIDGYEKIIKEQKQTIALLKEENYNLRVENSNLRALNESHTST